MNMEQGNVTAGCEFNNNISAGRTTCSSTGKGPAISCCNESRKASQVHDTSEGSSPVVTDSTDSSNDVLMTGVTSSDRNGSMQSKSLGGVDSPTTGGAGGHVREGLHVECPDSDPEQSTGGQLQIMVSCSGCTPEAEEVCCESGEESAQEEESEEVGMRNCSCDESSLCFCTSSSFNVRDSSRRHQSQVSLRKPKRTVIRSRSEGSKTQSRKMDSESAAEEVRTEGMGSNGTINGEEDSEDVKKCKSFMEDLVDRIFNNSASICQEDNAKFGEYCQSAVGRQWFARLIDNQRVNSKKVTEQTFYRLVQFFAVCLFECNDADDFTPGKSLMNMCFTFYHEHEGFPRCDDTTQKSFLFSHLTEQPIWKSLRFWNAAFFDAVHQERKQRSPDNQVNWRHLSEEERENTETMNENITFGQLATFLHNMMELELSHDMCQEFLDKMATIGNLSSDQKELIQSNIGQHFHMEIEENSKNKRHHIKPFNKLVFKRRTRHESMS